jgi:exodeoxyribonuclease V alpha subunit
LVFNGDIGEILEINDDVITVRFGNDQTVEYEDITDIQDLTHAYCITIHKSQGSEFPAVVIPLVSQHYTMLRRKIVYTALTRAKNICVFVGSYKALAIAVNNFVENVRFSYLADFIIKNPPQKCKNTSKDSLFDME